MNFFCYIYNNILNKIKINSTTVLPECYDCKTNELGGCLSPPLENCEAINCNECSYVQSCSSSGGITLYCHDAKRLCENQLLNFHDNIDNNENHKGNNYLGIIMPFVLLLILPTIMYVIYKAYIYCKCKCFFQKKSHRENTSNPFFITGSNIPVIEGYVPYNIELDNTEQTIQIKNCEKIKFTKFINE